MTDTIRQSVKNAIDALDSGGNATHHTMQALTDLVIALKGIRPEFVKVDPVNGAKVADLMLAQVRDARQTVQRNGASGARDMLESMLGFVDTLDKIEILIAAAAEETEN